MATFILTAKSNIPMPAPYSPIRQFTQKEVEIGTQSATATTLFTNYQTKEVLASQMNIRFGTGDFFTKDNIVGFAGYFSVRKV